MVLEYHGYDVIFRIGKVFLRHITIGWVKQISVRFKNFYALKVKDACKAFKRKEDVRDFLIERENKLPLNMQPLK